MIMRDSDLPISVLNLLSPKHGFNMIINNLGSKNSPVISYKIFIYVTLQQIVMIKYLNSKRRHERVPNSDDKTSY